MKQIKNKFGILGESHGQDRKHKEEITIFKNPAENQQRNKENNILEVLRQALRKPKKTCRKHKIIFQNSFLSHPKFQDLEKTKNQKNQKIFQNSFLSHPKFQDLERTKKTKRTKKTNISELFLETPQIPRPGKNKKTKEPKNQYFRTLSGDTPNSKTSGNMFFFCFFCFFFGFLQVFVKRLEILFLFSTGFLVFFLRACPGTSRILFSLFLFGFLQDCFNFLSQGVPCWCSEEFLDQLNYQSIY